MQGGRCQLLSGKGAHTALVRVNGWQPACRTHAFPPVQHVSVNCELGGGSGGGLVLVIVESKSTEKNEVLFDSLLCACALTRLLGH